ncbi:MAG: MopE-related protein, partial [Bacteroidota bacterium]
IPCPLMGIWQNDVQDDFDWLVNSGTTPSPNTGPSADADGDGQYVYIESSGASCGDQSRAILLSDCLEINTQGTADCHFSFEYHAFGTRIDTLFLDISLDAGGTWRNLWKTNGNKGDQWLKTYINLTDYEGQTARLRFVATGGRGNVSDIALDNLIFYGSTPTSSSTEVYYLDADSDGFGNPNISLEACDGIVPTGYVLDNTDCDDSNPSANPDAEELPCNGIDENCNGLTDDFELSPPIVDDVTICSGETGVIFSTLTEGDYVFWYDAPTAGSIVFPDFGSGFPFTAPENLSDTTQVYTFYAEAKSNTNFNCVSQPRTPASFIVPPNPQLSVREQALVCEGQLLNLSNLNVFDERNTGATISFHTAFPPTTDNELSNTNAIIRSDTTFYLLATSPDACTDMDSITIEAINGIDFDIRQGDSLSICLDATDTLQLDINAFGDNYTVEWNTGDTTEFLPIRANAQPGFVDRYLVIVTSETGCQRTDFIYVTTVESIDSVRTNITDVSACSTTDGTISLQPQGGVSPFRYEWSGAVSGTQSNVNGDYTIQNLPTGTYSVTIIDNSTAACPKIINNLVVNQPVAEVTIASLREVSCFAASDGRIAISVAGNDPQVEWNTGARGTVIEELRADTYSVSVMDNDCETVLDIVLSEPAALQLNPEVTHPRCADTNDGEIRLGVLGGTAPFRYQWSNNVTTRHLQDIPNGAYQVIVTDANDCQITSPTLSVAAPDSLQIRLDELLDVRCAEEQNGRILLTTQGGTAPYNYLWSDGTDTEDLTNISGGSYQLKITDAAGCEQRDSFFINNPTAL